MKRIYRQNYVITSLLLVVIALIIASCGGSDEGGYVAPDLTGEGQTSQQLVSKDVDGFLYHLSSLSSSEDGEEEELFSVLDVPITGEEGFLEQVNQYISETSSSRANPGDREELINAFTEEANRYQSLPSWSSSVQLFGLYDDNPVPLNGDGSFAGTVSAGIDDETVGLEIFVSEENCYEVETISESDLTISSSESGAILKSCPKQIIIKPGECRIFEVFAKPSVNLKDAGLDFTLKNPEYGCVLGPIFIKCKGQLKNTVAYGILYCKKSLDTPLDTAIKAETLQGQSLNIPVQVVKKTASVSGKVNTGGAPLVKGHVKSIGPKACCKLDEQGNYVLPKTFMGSQRKVVATWWTLEGGKQIKHREVKYIDLVWNMTEVDFGVVEVRHPLDPYYDRIIDKVYEQKCKWEEELGPEQGVKKTVNWLNKEVTIPPLPSEIAVAIAGAKVDDYNPKEMWVVFADKNELIYHLYGEIPDFIPLPPDTSISKNYNTSQPSIDKFTSIDSLDSLDKVPVETVKNTNIVILEPFRWQRADPMWNMDRSVSSYLIKQLSSSHDMKCKRLAEYAYLSNDVYHYDNPNAEFRMYVDKDLGKIYPEIVKEENIIRPADYEYIDEFGVIYIGTHGARYDMIACPIYYKKASGTLPVANPFNLEHDKEISEWIQEMELLEWETDEHYYTINAVLFNGCLIHCIGLTREFFNRQNFSDSLVFVEACNSWNFHLARPEVTFPPPYDYTLPPAEGAFHDAKVYLGFTKITDLQWGREISYAYFRYLMTGFDMDFTPLMDWDEPEIPDPLPEDGVPMSVKYAHSILEELTINPDPQNHSDPNQKDCKLELDTQNGQYDNTYFPAPTTVIVY